MDSQWTSLSSSGGSLVDKISSRIEPPAAEPTPSELAAPLMLVAGEICDTLEVVIEAMRECFAGFRGQTHHTARLMQKVDFFRRLHELLRAVPDPEAPLAKGDEASFEGILSGLLRQRLRLCDSFHADMLGMCDAFVKEVSRTIHRQEADLCKRVRSMDAACSEWVSRQRAKRAGSTARLARKETALRDIWRDLVSVASDANKGVQKAQPMLLDSEPPLSARIEQGLYLLEGGAAECLRNADTTDAQIAEQKVRELEGGIQSTCEQLSRLQSRSLKMFDQGTRLDPRARVHTMREIERDTKRLRGRLRGLLHRRNARRDALIRAVSQPGQEDAAPDDRDGDLRDALRKLLAAATTIRTAKRDADVRNMEIEQLACSEVGARALEGFETLSEWLRGYSRGLGKITLRHLRQSRDRLLEHQRLLHQDVEYVLEQMRDHPDKVGALYDSFSHESCRLHEHHVADMVRILLAGLEMIDSQRVFDRCSEDS